MYKKERFLHKRIFEVLDADVSIKDVPDAKGIEAFEDKIEFRNVTFAYGKHNVIEDFNLTINKGETVALVGQSGSWKIDFGEFNYSFLGCEIFWSNFD